MARRNDTTELASIPEVRDTLFGDMRLRDWAGHAGPGEPWASFAEAYASLQTGDRSNAIAKLLSIAERAGLESRHYLEAWHSIRELGGDVPAAKAKLLYGVVVEVTLDEGLDLLAAYADHTARYYNYSGAAIFWEHPDDSLDNLIDAVIAAGRHVAAQIGPWDKTRPPPPPKGHARISMLTPSGLHFGQASITALAADPLGGPVFQAATSLMQVLIGKPGKRS